MLKDLQKFFSERDDQNIIAIILVGSISWILTMFRSGSCLDANCTSGIGFWGANGHDGIWHISLANSLSQGKFNLPIYSGASIKNYHIGFDLLLALIHKITFISLIDLYFKFMPIVISLSIGSLVYRLLRDLKWNNSQIFWSLFFVYFGGNFALGFGGESTFWSQQSISTLINPPFALSLIFILAGLIFLQQKKLLLSAILFGLLIQIKAYASVVVLGSLFIIAIWQFYKLKKTYLLKIFFISIFISAVIFLPFNLHANSLFEFRPFWFLETMMQFPDRVGWTKFGEAMVNYKLAGNLIKGIPAYFLAFVIFFYGNMGTRFLFEFFILKPKVLKTKFDQVEIILLLSILIGISTPMFFVQHGTAWNTLQFFYYSLFFSGILSGYIFSEIISTKANYKYKKMFIVALVILTLHTSFKSLKDIYLTSRPPAKVSKLELSALEFLSDQPDGTILIAPFDRQKADLATANPPRPLYLYESTAYVSAFSGKQVFLEDEVNLDITGVDWQSRRKEVEDYFKSPDKQFLEKNAINYIYLVGDSSIESAKFGLKMIYDSEDVKILKYD